MPLMRTYILSHASVECISFRRRRRRIVLFGRCPGGGGGWRWVKGRGMRTFKMICVFYSNRVDDLIVYFRALLREGARKDFRRLYTYEREYLVVERMGGKKRRPGGGVVREANQKVNITWPGRVTSRD